MAYILHTSPSTSPAADYPEDKKVPAPLNPRSQDEKMSYPYRVRTRLALLLLGYMQTCLLAIAEITFSREISDDGRQPRATTWLKLGSALLDMPPLKLCLWVAFTAFIVLTLCIGTFEKGKLLGIRSPWTLILSKKWMVVCQMIIALIWVHAGAAWAVLKGPFVSTFGKGPDTVDYRFDVVVPLALTVTFFFTFVWNMSKYCEMIDERHVEYDIEEKDTEYEIKL